MRFKTSGFAILLSAGVLLGCNSQSVQEAQANAIASQTQFLITEMTPPLNACITYLQGGDDATPFLAAGLEPTSFGFKRSRSLTSSIRVRTEPDKCIITATQIAFANAAPDYLIEALHARGYSYAGSNGHAQLFRNADRQIAIGLTGQAAGSTSSQTLTLTIMPTPFG